MNRISLRPRAIEGLRRASKEYRLKLNKALDILRQGLFPPHTKKLGGATNGFRTRIGRWRILFTLKSREVEIADIFMKKGRGDYRRRN
jgi:mRNA-degrading endonuclease RelE of RelBE toxin-antitoxin system